jgi:hypothetical protein
MTPTIYAYYFCDKSKQILSDKEAAGMKALTLDNNFEMNDDMGVGAKYYRNNKDDDQVIGYIKTNSSPICPIQIRICSIQALMIRKLQI